MHFGLISRPIGVDLKWGPVRNGEATSSKPGQLLSRADSFNVHRFLQSFLYSIRVKRQTCRIVLRDGPWFVSPDPVVRIIQHAAIWLVESKLAWTCVPRLQRAANTPPPPPPWMMSKQYWILGGSILWLGDLTHQRASSTGFGPRVHHCELL